MKSLWRLLLIFYARRKIFFLILGVTVTSTLIISLLMPKLYKSTATMIVDYKTSDPVSGAIFQAQMMRSYMATQVNIAASRTVALRVVDDLKLADDPKTQQKYIEATNGKGALREWLADELLNKMQAIPARDSDTINISYVSTDPRTATRLANAFAEAYQTISAQMKAEPALKAGPFINDQIDTLRGRFEIAQKKLTDSQQKNGIANDNNRIDVEKFRLNDISSQLVTVQSQLMDATSRMRQMGRTGASNGTQDVLASQTIQTLKADLARAEARFSQIQERFTNVHPMYEQSQAEVNRLRASLRRETSLISTSVSNTVRVLEQREAELRSALSAQKEKVMQLDQKRDEIKVLSNELESAQRAYENASQRHAQNNMEGVYRQSDISVLVSATTPVLPTSPKPVRNSLLSILIGLLLGAASAILLEMVDRRVRSPYDLVERLPAPVFCVPTTNPPRRRPFMMPSRLMVPTAGLAISNRTGSNV